MLQQYLNKGGIYCWKKRRKASCNSVPFFNVVILLLFLVEIHTFMKQSNSWLRPQVNLFKLAETNIPAKKINHSILISDAFIILSLCHHVINSESYETFRINKQGTIEQASAQFILLNYFIILFLELIRITVREYLFVCNCHTT